MKDTLTINAPADFFRRTIHETREALRAVLRSTWTGAPMGEEARDEIARMCGVLGWLYEATISEELAETMYRQAPAPIPSERRDYSDLVDWWSAHDPWEESNSSEFYDEAA